MSDKRTIGEKVGNKKVIKNIFIFNIMFYKVHGYQNTLKPKIQRCKINN